MKHKIATDLQPLAVPVSELKPMDRNPRRGDVSAVAKSYDRFGQRKPIVARKNGMVIAGNHQLKAAQRLGWTHIAVVWVDDNETEATAYALADNRISDLGDYDNSTLIELLSELNSIDESLIDATGYERDYLDKLLAITSGDAYVEEETRHDETGHDQYPSIVRPGDVWILGRHRLMCGDSRNSSDVRRLVDGSIMNLAVTSPPYADRRKYDETTEFRPIPPIDYVEWFAPVAQNVADHLADDGSWVINIKAAADGLDRDLYVMDLVVAHVREWGWRFGDEFCWERNGVPKKPTLRFKNQWEPVYQFARNRWKFRPDQVKVQSENAVIPLGKARGNTDWRDRQGRSGSKFIENVDIGIGYAYPGNRLPSFSGTHEATGHNAAFPVGLPEFFIKAYTDVDDRVFDPFTGSGSTILAAEHTNRIAYGMELSPKYCDIACARFERHTGIKPRKDNQ